MCYYRPLMYCEKCPLTFYLTATFSLGFTRQITAPYTLRAGKYRSLWPILYLCIHPLSYRGFFLSSHTIIKKHSLLMVGSGMADCRYKIHTSVQHSTNGWLFLICTYTLLKFLVPIRACKVNCEICKYALGPLTPPIGSSIKLLVMF